MTKDSESNYWEREVGFLTEEQMKALAEKLRVAREERERKKMYGATAKQVHQSNKGRKVYGQNNE